MAIASRPGNKWLREFAEEHRDKYLQLKRTNKKEKTRYIDSLVDEIYRCDRYFFRIVSNNYHIMKSKYYNIVSADEMSQNSHHIIHRKIQQLLNPSNVPKIVNPPDDTNTNNNNSQSRGKKTSYFLRSSTDTSQIPSSAATAQSPNFNRDGTDEKTWWRYYNFLHDNPDLEHDIWSICDDLYKLLSSSD